MLGLATSVLCMYDVEKHSAALENVWLHETRHVYIRPGNKMAALGMFIYNWGTNFAFHQALYESKCHER